MPGNRAELEKETTDMKRFLLAAVAACVLAAPALAETTARPDLAQRVPLDQTPQPPTRPASLARELPLTAMPSRGPSFDAVTLGDGHGHD